MITKQKQQYPINARLGQYLYRFDRFSDIPSVYDSLTNFTSAIPYEDPSGKETLWMTVSYRPEERIVIYDALIKIYAELKIGGGDDSLHNHLFVDRVDFGEFGNSRPFRIKVTNQYNDNADYFYVKRADVSRIFGLEIEHVLSPSRMNYLVSGNTLIEDHIAGVPGNTFLKEHLVQPNLNRVRIAKEFTKFNERCFIRLLGDMRSVNYVVDMIPDFEEIQYRVRSIDFDQQSYEGKGKVYLSYNFRSNRAIVKLSFQELNKATIRQYAEEERSQMARRAAVEKGRLSALLGIMESSEIAPQKHFQRLAKDLDTMHKTSIFQDCKSMGQLTSLHIKHMLTIS